MILATLLLASPLTQALKPCHLSRHDKRQVRQAYAESQTVNRLIDRLRIIGLDDSCGEAVVQVWIEEQDGKLVKLALNRGSK